MTTLNVVLASELESGRYLCLKTRSPLGLIVRLVTGSQFDHSVLYLGDGAIAEATTSGVRIDRLAKYAGQLAAANSAEWMPDSERETVAAAARSFTGREYGWLDLLVILARKLGFHQKFLLRSAENRGALICSELVALSGLAAGLAWWLCGQVDASQVTPAELAARSCMRTVIWDQPEGKRHA